MNSNTSVIISLVSSGLILIAGVLMITGVFLTRAEKSTTMVLGGCLAAWAIFRLLNTYYKMKSAKMEEQREEMKKQTEKLLKRK